MRFHFPKGGMAMGFRLLPAVLWIAASVLSASEESSGRQISITLKYTIENHGKSGEVYLTTLIPKTVENRQKILKIAFSTKPAKEFEENGDSYALFILN